MFKTYTNFKDILLFTLINGNFWSPYYRLLHYIVTTPN